MTRYADVARARAALSTPVDSDPDRYGWTVVVARLQANRWVIPASAYVQRSPVDGLPTDADQWLDRAAVHAAHIAATTGLRDPGQIVTAAIGSTGCGCWPGPAPSAVTNIAAPVVARLSDPFYCGRPGCDGHPHDAWVWSHARADQQPPGDTWTTWIELSGRGAGKTRSGAEWTTALARRPIRLAAVGPTADSVRGLMIEVPSGLIACAHPDNPARYEPAIRRVTYASGAVVSLFSAEEPDRLRGPEHEAAWLDEACHYAKPADVWMNLLLGLRIGEHPRVKITTTPKPSRWLTDLLAHPGTIRSTASTYANIHNLAKPFRDDILGQYEGTRLGRQEIHAELIAEVEGALWSMDELDQTRIAEADQPNLSQFAIGVDPAGTARATSDETGIVVAGLARDDAGHPSACIIGDESGRFHADRWAALVVDIAHDLDAVVYLEVSGSHPESLVSLLRNTPGGHTVPLREVRADKSKTFRAEVLHQHFVHGRAHLLGHLPGLEEQMIGWAPGSTFSPDRLDAAGHAVEGLLGPVSTISPPAAIPVDPWAVLARDRVMSTFATRTSQNWRPR